MAQSDPGETLIVVTDSTGSYVLGKDGVTCFGPSLFYRLMAEGKLTDREVVDYAPSFEWKELPDVQ